MTASSNSENSENGGVSRSNREKTISPGNVEPVQYQVTLDPFSLPGYVGTKSLDEVARRNEARAGISLFTGAGGFDIGMSQAGFESRVMVEIDKDCIGTLQCNWFWSELQKRKDADGNPLWKNKEEMKKEIDWYHDREPVIINKDIRMVTTKEILDAAGLGQGEAAVVFGSPPCQGFSTTNRRRSIDDPRNFLFQEFVRIVREALPKGIILENVPGMVSSTKGRVMREICEEFANCGYSIVWDILDAVNYGVPQHRKRVFLLGKRVDLMYFPEVGNPRLCMGAQPGEIKHPAWFLKKYKKIVPPSSEPRGSEL